MITKDLANETQKSSWVRLFSVYTVLKTLLRGLWLAEVRFELQLHLLCVGHPAN